MGTAIASFCTNVVGKVILAVIVWFVGKMVVKKVLEVMGKISALDKIEPNTKTFALSAIKWLLYVVLVVSIVAILGVPMASVITVLGTAGAAIALSLQGSLSNLAGGIMMVIFKPWSSSRHETCCEVNDCRVVYTSLKFFSCICPHWLATCLKSIIPKVIANGLSIIGNRK